MPGGGVVDCVVTAAGVLGDQAHFEEDPTAAAEALTANYTGPVATQTSNPLPAIDQTVRTQGALVLNGSSVGATVKAH